MSKKKDNEEKDQCECGKKPGKNYYSYYDSPDGCDVDKKVLVTTRYGIMAGLVFGTYDVLMYSHAVGLGPIMKRYMKHTIPLAAMGATFALVANGVQLARKENDMLNYFIGGFACGPILALYTGTAHGMAAGGVILGAVAMLKKGAVDNGYTLFPTPVRFRRNHAIWHMDGTLVKDPRDECIESCPRKA